MLVLLQLGTTADTPLNVTVPDPEKAVPVIVINWPAEPDVGLKLVMFGATVNCTPLLAWPATVTATLPVVAADGTGAVILVSLQVVGVAEVPLNVSVLVP